MASMRYVGRPADAGAGIVNKEWADEAHVARMSDVDFVVDTLNQAALDAYLQPLSYASARDLLRATTTAVEAADTLYAESSLRNHPTSGVAGLDASGYLIASQVPGDVTTDRVVQSYTVTPENTYLTDMVVSTSTAFRDKRLASITVPDPGYAWIPMPYAAVTGQSSDDLPPEGYWGGNGVCGLLSVAADTGDTVYGRGVCTDSFAAATRYLIPSADAGATPLTVPPVEGELTLNLYGSCFQGSGYIFSASSEFDYVIYAFPAV
jgi:hypothetical protein